MEVSLSRETRLDIVRQSAKRRDRDILHPKRGVGAQGQVPTHEGGQGIVEITVSTDTVDAAQGISVAQSAFMNAKAQTTGFEHKIVLDGDKLEYEQTTYVNIYGKENYQHTDKNILYRQ